MSSSNRSKKSRRSPESSDSEDSSASAASSASASSSSSSSDPSNFVPNSQSLPEEISVSSSSDDEENRRKRQKKEKTKEKLKINKIAQEKEEIREKINKTEKITEKSSSSSSSTSDFPGLKEMHFPSGSSISSSSAQQLWLFEFPLHFDLNGFRSQKFSIPQSEALQQPILFKLNGEQFSLNEISTGEIEDLINLFPAEETGKRTKGILQPGKPFKRFFRIVREMITQFSTIQWKTGDSVGSIGAPMENSSIKEKFADEAKHLIHPEPIQQITFQAKSTLTRPIGYLKTSEAVKGTRRGVNFQAKPVEEKGEKKKEKKPAEKEESARKSEKKKSEKSHEESRDEKKKRKKENA